MSEVDNASLSLEALLGEMDDVSVKPDVSVKSEPVESVQQPPPARQRQRRRRNKAPTSRMPVYGLGSELSVDERLARFNSETEVEMDNLRSFCSTMSTTLQKERERVRKRDDSPERKKQDQFVGSIKHKVDTIGRRLKSMQEDLMLRNQQLRSEYEVEKGRLLIEREQLNKTSMHWCHAGGLITTPHQRRLQDAAAGAEENARTVVQFKRQPDVVS